MRVYYKITKKTTILSHPESTSTLRESTPKHFLEGLLLPELHLRLTIFVPLIESLCWARLRYAPPLLNIFSPEYKPEYNRPFVNIFPRQDVLIRAFLRASEYNSTPLNINLNIIVHPRI